MLGVPLNIYGSRKLMIWRTIAAWMLLVTGFFSVILGMIVRFTFLHRSLTLFP